MFTKDREQVCSSAVGCFPNLESLYHTIPRDARMHMERVAVYGDTLYRFMRKKDQERIDREMGVGFAPYSRKVFQMHDIGRHYIPVSILNKVDKLTDEEYQIIRDHAINAAKAIDSLYKKPFPEDVMMQFYNIAVYHHERYDGKGYPLGLAGEDIPLGARICAVADSYDGITSWKPYKRRQTTRAEAVDIICRESGGQFDPYVIEMFRTCSALM